MDPGNTILTEEARKEQMPKIFGLSTTEIQQLECKRAIKEQMPKIFGLSTTEIRQLECKRAIKEQMPKIFGLSTTVTRQLESIAERGKALSHIQNPVGHLPIEVDDLPMERPPSVTPVQRSKTREKFLHTVGPGWVQA